MTGGSAAMCGPVVTSKNSPGGQTQLSGAFYFGRSLSFLVVPCRFSSRPLSPPVASLSPPVASLPGHPTCVVLYSVVFPPIYSGGSKPFNQSIRVCKVTFVACFVPSPSRFKGNEPPQTSLQHLKMCGRFILDVFWGGESVSGIHLVV